MFKKKIFFFLNKDTNELITVSLVHGGSIARFNELFFSMNFRVRTRFRAERRHFFCSVRIRDIENDIATTGPV